MVVIFTHISHISDNSKYCDLYTILANVGAMIKNEMRNYEKENNIIDDSYILL